MDTKEAIEILAKMQNYDSERNVEALEIAISALEKAPTLEAENARLMEKETPKKPINKHHAISGMLMKGNCPNCKNEVYSDEKFCSQCATLLMWSSDKE